MSGNVIPLNGRAERGVGNGPATRADPKPLIGDGQGQVLKPCLVPRSADPFGDFLSDFTQQVIEAASRLESLVEHLKSEEISEATSVACVRPHREREA